MRKVLYGLNVSLDGFYEDINGKIDFTVPEEEVFRHFIELEKEVEVHLYGRKMYETMCYWKVDQNFDSAELEYAKVWNKKPNVVFSRTLEIVAPNDRLIRDNIAQEVDKLKKGPGKYMAVGGGEIASTFINLGQTTTANGSGTNSTWMHRLSGRAWKGLCSDSRRAILNRSMLCTQSKRSAITRVLFDWMPPTKCQRSERSARLSILGSASCR